MYPNKDSVDYGERAAFIMASTGETVTYAAFDARANRLAHLLRSAGLQHQDHYAIMMENNDRYMEACAAGERAGPLLHLCELLPHGGRVGLHSN
jgi:long-chain acyl-CoA synthetase